MRRDPVSETARISRVLAVRRHSDGFDGLFDILDGHLEQVIGYRMVMNEKRAGCIRKYRWRPALKAF
jgi:hypothetical protein